MDLLEEDVTAHKNYRGTDVLTVEAHKKFKMGSTGEAGLILEAQCPAGKVWEVTVSVAIDETDA